MSNLKETKETAEVVIVGGGLSGLTAAAFLARAGRQVKVFEKASEPGGRAATHHYGEFLFNQGAHALYQGGAGLKVLNELGVEFKGHVPNLSRSLALYRGELQPLPTKATDFLTTSLLGLTKRAELIGFLAKLSFTKPQAVAHLSCQQWVEQECRHEEVRELLLAIARLSTYTNAPQYQSAAVFVQQLQMSLKSNVSYIDGGWETLVEGLQQAAEAAGAQIVTGARVEAVEYAGGKVQGVRLADGIFYPASAVIIAATPQVVSQLVDAGANPVLNKWGEEAIPVRAACLEVALERLPKPENVFMLGIDQPVYFSVHSEWARLGPEGKAVIHVLKYIGAEEKSDAKADEAELEAVLDKLQPGWQDELLERRFLPHMVVYNMVVRADRGAYAGRPGPEVPGIANLYLAGDWVGSEGILSDAAFASARQAAHLILNRSVAARSEVSLAGVGGKAS